MGEGHQKSRRRPRQGAMCSSVAGCDVSHVFGEEFVPEFTVGVAGWKQVVVLPRAQTCGMLPPRRGAGTFRGWRLRGLHLTQPRPMR